MKRFGVIAALIAVPVLAGCNSTTNVSATSAASSAASSSTGSQQAGSGAQTTPPTAAETSTASDGSSMTKPFGSTFTWDDKLAVTVSKPTPFTPSEFAYTGGKFKKFVAMTVVLKNGTSKVYESIGFTTNATSGDQQTEAVIDSEKGVDIPSAKILPGKSLTFKVAFGYTPGQDFTLTVNSIDRFDRADGIYNTKL